MPLDSLRDFLDQLASAHRVWLRSVVPGSELSRHLLPMERSWIFNLVYEPALILPPPFPSPHLTFLPTFRSFDLFSSVPSQQGCWKGTPETGDNEWAIANEYEASGTYVNSDCYHTLVFTEWEIVPVIHSLGVSSERNGKFHSEAIIREEEDRRPRTPTLLSIATSVSDQWYHHSRILL